MVGEGPRNLYYKKYYLNKHYLNKVPDAIINKKKKTDFFVQNTEYLKIYSHASSLIITNRTSYPELQMRHISRIQSGATILFIRDRCPSQ